MSDFGLKVVHVNRILLSRRDNFAGIESAVVGVVSVNRLPLEYH